MVTVVLFFAKGLLLQMVLLQNNPMVDNIRLVWQVDELMGDTESAVSSYSRAVHFLFFLLVEAPSLIVNPPFALTNSDRFRLWNYISVLNDRQGISRSARMSFLKTDDADQL